MLVAESDLNNPRLITARQAGGYGRTRSGTTTSTTPCTRGDRGTAGVLRRLRRPAGLAKTLTRAYFHDGTWSEFRGGPTAARWTPGIRPAGGSSYRPGPRPGRQPRAGRPPPGPWPLTRTAGLLRRSGLLFTSPCTPMLFMGEEWGADTPWQFFTDHTDPRSRRRHRRSPGGVRLARLGRPTSPTPRTRRRSPAPGWTGPSLDGTPPRLLGWYRDLLALRRSRPVLVHLRFDRGARRLRRGPPLAAHPPRPAPIAANRASAEAILPIGQATVTPRLALLASAPGISVATGRRSRDARGHLRGHRPVTGAVVAALMAQVRRTQRNGLMTRIPA